MADFEKLKIAVGEMDEDAVMEIVNEIVATKGDAQAALAACQDGMGIVGERFEAGEYFVGDMIFGGELMGQAMDALKPRLASDSVEELGKIILCTVAGDIHDIGKNIVKAMMSAGGFEVIDLGVDVAPETIVETAKKEDVKIIGLSGILTLACDSMKATCKALEEAGIRDNVHVILGGNPVTDAICLEAGADAFTTNPQEGVEICRKWALS